MPALFILLIIAVVIAGPFIIVWALNTLFPVLAIPYTFWTWLAILVVTGIFKTDISAKGKSK